MITESNYWTDNFDEIELVMSYVIPGKEYYMINKLEKEEKIEFLNKYWNKLDPDSTTVKNELLDELNKRVIESKELFYGIDGGLLSDRAKIYIIYPYPVPPG